ncbi:MAG: AAA family ATPase [Hyphomonadaceae bacterium]|nr:AAA family ATPase [Hyphomonadaceae bacterium]
MKVIAITGGSGAGKSTIARAVAGRLGAPIVSEDDYYHCATSIADFDADRHNFDAPQAKQHDLLIQHLRLARAGKAFEKPVYDLRTHTRQIGTEWIEPHNALVVEGIHLLTTPELRDCFDLSVFVEADESLRLQRRIARDVSERARTLDSIEAQFRTNVAPMHDLHVAPQRDHAHIIIVSAADATEAHADEAAARIIEALG